MEKIWWTHCHWPGRKFASYFLGFRQQVCLVRGPRPGPGVLVPPPPRQPPPVSRRRHGQEGEEQRVGLAQGQGAQRGVPERRQSERRILKVLGSRIQDHLDHGRLLGEARVLVKRQAGGEGEDWL